jgi:hypothetical protein
LAKRVLAGPRRSSRRSYASRFINSECSGAEHTERFDNEMLVPVGDHVSRGRGRRHFTELLAESLEPRLRSLTPQT